MKSMRDQVYRAHGTVSSTLDKLAEFMPSEPSEPVGDLDSTREWAFKKQLKYADYGDSLWIPGVGRFHSQWEGSPYTAGQIAKAYMRYQGWEWPLHRPGEIEKDLSPALYFTGPATGSWSYLDLKSAYWQIGSRLPWWEEGPFRKTRIDDTVGPWKGTELLMGFRRPRLVLFGLLAYPGGNTLWINPDGTESYNECPEWASKYGNKIWAQSVLYVVHAFAQELMRTFPCPLFMTDGAMIPMALSNTVIEWAAQNWNLELREKERGEGTVAGPGNYEFRATYKEQISEPMASHDDIDTGKVRNWWARRSGTQLSG